MTAREAGAIGAESLGGGAGGGTAAVDARRTAADRDSGRALRASIRIPLALRRRRALVHQPAAVAGLGELMGYQRALTVVRALGIVVLLALAPNYELLHPLLLVASVAAFAGVLVHDWKWRRAERSLDDWRERARVGLVVDSAALYLAVLAFAADASWLGYFFYPLLALEAALAFGMRGALTSSAVSVGVYLLQVQMRSGLGFVEDPRHHQLVVILFALHAFFLGSVARVSHRVRADLTTLLGLSAALARQNSPETTLRTLDARLRDLLGARVRSVALRQPDGGYEVVLWRSRDRGRIDRDALKGVSHAVGFDVDARMLRGQAVTLGIVPGRIDVLAYLLGLPEWARAITLVPIHTEGEVVGVLPVLWETTHWPSSDEIDLLHGLADQTGLAFAQAQLQQAREMATTDPLTGLVNHGAFKDLLAAECANAERDGGRLALLFCDLDRFKAVNDTLGHAAGDELLRRVAAACRDVARNGDVIARYGGDELALILPGADQRAAVDVAERLQRAVRELDRGWGLDLTIGVACFPSDAPTVQELLLLADAAMYQGKHAGRGRIALAAAVRAQRTASPGDWAIA